MRLLLAMFSTRKLDINELVSRINAAGGGHTYGGETGSPPLPRLRVTQRLLSGFRTPFRENAVAALVLRRLGYAADLVIGYEPIPETSRHRRLFAWVEVGGAPIATIAPAQTYLQELIRFPRQDHHHDRTEHGRARL